ncbi:MAG TPA: PDZ domain-containing protein [Pirellulales bacterium]|nr:PDZ domain-containing protein [Pirellulales bacterium]
MNFRLAFAFLAVTAICAAGSAFAAQPPATKAHASRGQALDTGAVASPQAIGQWVGQLGSDSYTVREAASDALIQAGRPAIASVVAASQKDDLEVTTRAVQILAAMLKSSDVDTADAAATALTKIAAVRNASTAAMAAAGVATDALGDYEQMRQERTLAEIRRLGGTVVVGNPLTGSPDGVQITLDADWHGGAAGLRLLKHVPNLEYLSVHGVAMSDEDLAELRSLSRLSAVELFGTKVTAAGSEKFAQSHPATRVDRRSNAKLGIMGENGTCKIAMVQPGSAAERGGLMPEDVILKFQGRPVNDFATLTKEIGSCDAGDKVKLEISRDNQTIEKEVTLGAWSK